jgi:hypothetical protein
MDPTQSQLGGQAVELRSIITQKQFNNGVIRLGSVGRDSQSFFHPLAQRVCLGRQGPIQDGVELVLGVGLMGWQKDRKQALPLGRDAKLPQQLEGKVVHLKDGIGSPLQHTKEAETIFARHRRVGGIQAVAEDMTLFLFAIDGGAGTARMLPWATCQPGIPHGSVFRMERLLVFDQHIRELPSTDRHSHGVQEVQNVGLACSATFADRVSTRFISAMTTWRKPSFSMVLGSKFSLTFSIHEATTIDASYQATPNY